MKHLFLDANVVLDFLTRREPFGAVAADLFQLAEEGHTNLYVSSLSFSHVLYLLRKSVGGPAARSLVADLAEMVIIVGVDSKIVQEALVSTMPDFEDAIQYFAALSIPAIDALVTRDPKGFTASALPMLAPAEALRSLR